MHTLHMDTVEQNSDVYRVYWSTGEKNKGVIEVLDTSSDGKLIAELVAIRFLVTEKEVFGDRFHGNKIKFSVSNGQVKKLLSGRSDKKHLMKFVNYFFICMKAADIEVSKRRSNFLPDLNTDKDIVLKVSDYSCPNHVVEIDRIGRLEVSLHAIEQFIERQPFGEINHPWKSLYNQLNSEALVQVKLPEKVIEHKKRKHGQAAEIWKHETSTIHFLLIENDDCSGKILVTVANRNEQLDKV